eukprot:7391808-Prymnesium_polylepis.2
MYSRLEGGVGGAVIGVRICGGTGPVGGGEAIGARICCDGAIGVRICGGGALTAAWRLAVEGARTTRIPILVNATLNPDARRSQPLLPSAAMLIDAPLASWRPRGSRLCGHSGTYSASCTDSKIIEPSSHSMGTFALPMYLGVEGRPETPRI